LVVKYKSLEIKQKIVEKSFGKKLTLKHNNEIISISVTHDKTEKQREEAKRIYEMKKIHKSNDTENFQRESRGTKMRWATIVKQLH